MAESTLEPPSCFEHGTSGLGIQRLNHYFVMKLMKLESHELKLLSFYLQILSGPSSTSLTEAF